MEVRIKFHFKHCFPSAETIRTIRDGEPRTAPSTFTLQLGFILCSYHRSSCCPLKAMFVTVFLNVRAVLSHFVCCTVELVLYFSMNCCEVWNTCWPNRTKKKTKKQKKNKKKWRCRGLNPGPFTCEANALPLKYIPCHAGKVNYSSIIVRVYTCHCVRRYVKRFVWLVTGSTAQELCESRGGRPGLPVTNLLSLWSVCT